MRQVVLDTETTGLEPSQGHRIIEIGCVELVDRRHTGNRFHRYLQPDRAVESAAYAVHGISDEFLRDKPRFADVASELVHFLAGAELIIHNASFDVGFLDHELARLDTGVPRTVQGVCRVLDTLELARRLHPGQKNSLDALCKRYGVDNSERDLHGALLDAEILADVYLAMTGGQATLDLSERAPGGEEAAGGAETRARRRAGALRVIRACEAERAAHARMLNTLDEAHGAECLFRLVDTAGQ